MSEAGSRAWALTPVPGRIDGSRLFPGWSASSACMALRTPDGLSNMTKIVAGKQLWNYDNLEPAEKKIVL